MRRRALLATLVTATSLLAGCQTLSDACTNPELITTDEPLQQPIDTYARVINGDDIEHTVCATVTQDGGEGTTTVHERGYTLKPAAVVLVYEFTTPGTYTFTVQLGDVTRRTSINLTKASLNDIKNFAMQFKISDDGTLTNASGGDG